MINSLILIVNELNIAKSYRNRLDQDPSAKIEIAQTPDEAIENAALFEPDLIIISHKFNDNDGFDLCKKLRDLPLITRPVIVMVSDDMDENAEIKIKGIRSGADDYLCSQITDDEFSVRIYAHLRRHIEALSDQSTHLVGSGIINTNLKRKINLQSPWSLTILTLNNFKYYNESYGDLAANQLLRAFIAIIKANLDKDDFLGYLGNEDFAIITNPLKAEKLAESICKTFDKIIPRFYAPFEAERGFTIFTYEEKTSLKIPLVSVNGGIISNTYRNFDSYKTALSIANNLKELAKHQLYSGLIIDRPLLSGDESSVTREPYILVVESDAALAYLLTTTLEMQGYKAEATTSKSEAIKLVDSKRPDIVLIDAVMQGNEGWEICDYIRQNEDLFNTKIIMATVLHDKEKALSSGADVYIPKPYDLISLHKWINKILGDRYSYR